MEIDNLLNITTRSELRTWLLNNHQDSKYCWLIVSVKEQPNTLLYLDVVEEALCFGWIDGIKKKTDSKQQAQRISIRSKKSNWTQLNIQRAKRLIRLNLMHESGYKALPSHFDDEFIIHETIMNAIKDDEEILENFNSFPLLYKLIRIDTIQAYISDELLFKKRLEKFLINTKQNKMYGSWHDNGRLIEE